MTGKEFKDMCNDVAAKEIKRRKRINKISLSVFVAWISLVSMGELIYWQSPNWWTIPLGITLVLMAIGSLVCLLSCLDM